MQITAGTSEILKTFQREIGFTLNVLSESKIHFSKFSMLKECC